MRIRKLISLGILVSVFGVLVAGAAYQTRANDRPPLSGEHKELISSNCETAQVSLRQLHRADASLRVNRGQLYEHIGSGLMARFNSRLALNRLDAGHLVAIAARYDQQLAEFRTTYKTYEERLSVTLNMSCRDRPEEFYYQIAAARQSRSDVYRIVTDLNTTTVQYYDEFARFALGYGVEVEGIDD